jgi:hypothetical protein
MTASGAPVAGRSNHWTASHPIQEARRVGTPIAGRANVPTSKPTHVSETLRRSKNTNERGPSAGRGSPPSNTTRSSVLRVAAVGYAGASPQGTAPTKTCSSTTTTKQAECAGSSATAVTTRWDGSITTQPYAKQPQGTYVAPRRPSTIPAITDVVPGTKGSAEYAQQRQAAR